MMIRSMTSKKSSPETVKGLIVQRNRSSLLEIKRFGMALKRTLKGQLKPLMVLSFPCFHKIYRQFYPILSTSSTKFSM